MSDSKPPIRTSMENCSVDGCRAACLPCGRIAERMDISAGSGSAPARVTTSPTRSRSISGTSNNAAPSQILSTLVHEMVHGEQHHYGKPSRGGYHNKQWADWME